MIICSHLVYWFKIHQDLELNADKSIIPQCISDWFFLCLEYFMKRVVAKNSKRQVKSPHKQEMIKGEEASIIYLNWWCHYQDTKTNQAGVSAFNIKYCLIPFLICDSSSRTQIEICPIQNFSSNLFVIFLEIEMRWCPNGLCHSWDAFPLC